eukprot:scaffold6855_cov126-Isochrysis_galbana.AAC.4
MVCSEGLEAALSDLHCVAGWVWPIHFWSGKRAPTTEMVDCPPMRYPISDQRSAAGAIHTSQHRHREVGTLLLIPSNESEILTTTTPIPGVARDNLIYTL